MLLGINNKKGASLMLVYALLSLVAVVSGIVFSTAIQSMKASQRRLDFIRAFYAAESGIDMALQLLPVSQSLLPVSPISGVLGVPEAVSEYRFAISSFDGSDSRLRINSTGFVPDSFSSPRVEVELEVIAEETNQVSSDNFLYAIETEGDLRTQGKAYTIDGDIKEGIELDFESLFGMEKDAMKENAVYLYDEYTFGAPVYEITWVDITPGEELTIAGNLEGSGILIIAGDTHISGTVDFYGIIYIIGVLRMSGNCTINGTVLVESGIDIDTSISGNVTVSYDADAIENALSVLSYVRILSWREIRRQVI
jgi:cytoskeletal protein CcmA (bactofilin family)